MRFEAHLFVSINVSLWSGFGKLALWYLFFASQAFDTLNRRPILPFDNRNKNK